MRWENSKTYNQWFSLPFGEENLIRFQEKGVKKSTMSDKRWAGQVRKVEYSLTQDKALQNTIIKQFHSYSIITELCLTRIQSLYKMWGKGTNVHFFFF